MGYVTLFELDIRTADNSMEHEKFDDIMEKFRKECEYAEYALDSCGQPNEDAKWYDHDNDMLALSLKYPDALFKLRGIGEDRTDMWIAYYKNGKMQLCEAVITYDEYDESKLEPVE